MARAVFANLGGGFFEYRNVANDTLHLIDLTYHDRTATILRTGAILHPGVNVCALYPTFLRLQ